MAILDWVTSLLYRRNLKWQKEDNEMQSTFIYAEKYPRNTKSMLNSVYCLGAWLQRGFLNNLLFQIIREGCKETYREVLRSLSLASSNVSILYNNSTISIPIMTFKTKFICQFPICMLLNDYTKDCVFSYRLWTKTKNSSASLNIFSIHIQNSIPLIARML